MLTVADLREIEKDEELLKFRFVYDGILMWPFIRFFVLQSAVINMLGVDIPKACAKNFSLQDILKYGFMTIKNNPYKNTAVKKGIVIFSTGGVNIKTQDGSFRNRLYDHFAFQHPDRTVIIEDSFMRKYFTPRVFKNVRYHDYIHMMASIKSRFLPTNRADEIEIGRFLDFLKSAFSCALPDSVWESSREILLKISGRLVFYHKYYARLFRMFEPKLLVVENGCYGNRGYVFKWAKDLGIKTCEMQHAIVFKNHPAYNYEAPLLERGYRCYLPDYFLSYGDYWNQRLSIPCNIVTIGNPHMAESLKSVGRDTVRAGSRKTILVVSSGSSLELTVKTVIDLRKRLDPDSFHIIFRPNPEELSICDARYGVLKENNIPFDREDLYDSLSKVDFLVSAELSTVLFEALAFDIPVYLFRSNWVEYNLSEMDFFNLFTSIDAVAEQIKTGLIGKKVNKNDLWDFGWRENYEKFLNDIAGLGSVGVRGPAFLIN